jgi:hypothetical protein
MEPSDARKGDNVPAAARFDGTRDRRIASERQVRPVPSMGSSRDSRDSVPSAPHDLGSLGSPALGPRFFDLRADREA